MVLAPVVRAVVVVLAVDDSGYRPRVMSGLVQHGGFLDAEGVAEVRQRVAVDQFQLV